MCKLTMQIDAALGRMQGAARVTPRELNACMCALRGHLAAAELCEESIAAFIDAVLDRMGEMADCSGAAVAAILREALHSVPVIRRALGHAARVPHFERCKHTARWDMKELSNRTRQRGWRALRPAAERRALVRGPLAPVHYDPKRYTPSVETGARDMNREQLLRMMRTLRKGHDGHEPPDMGPPALV